MAMAYGAISQSKPTVAYFRPAARAQRWRCFEALLAPANDSEVLGLHYDEK